MVKYIKIYTHIHITIYNNYRDLRRDIHSGEPKTEFLDVDVHIIPEFLDEFALVIFPKVVHIFKCFFVNLF